MGRWQQAWFDLMRAYTGNQISQAQFRAITDRHIGLPAGEPTLRMLLSATAAAKDEYARSKAAELAPEPAPDPASLASDAT